MIHPNTQVQYIGEEIGHGVFAVSFIPKGTITWVPDLLDREFTPDEFTKMPSLLYEAALTYCYRNHKGNYILPWDHTRYVNHSSNPNTMITPYGFEIAIRDIMPNEQISNDYGTLNIIAPFEPCKEHGGRQFVCPDDLIRLYPIWDQQIKDALCQYKTVEQPLLSLLPTDTIGLVDAVNKGESEPISILVIYSGAASQCCL
jgi:uncharacterized protein